MTAYQIELEEVMRTGLVSKALPPPTALYLSSCRRTRGRLTGTRCCRESVGWRGSTAGTRTSVGWWPKRNPRPARAAL